MNNNDTVKLNIGAGLTYIPGFHNIDISDRADITLDLNRDRLPFEDNSVDVVFTCHTIEHLDEYLYALSEIHRVLKHGGQFLVGVPYVTLTEYNLVNPYHKQHFNEFSFDFFDPERLLDSAAEEGQMFFRKVSHRFHYLPEFADESLEKKEFARRHYFNVVREIIFGVLAIKDLDAPLPITEETPSQLLKNYNKYLAARKSY
jgi:SAM-dependent methyltransferase